MLIYCSEVLCFTIMTHLDDLEAKVMDLQILFLFFVSFYMSTSLENKAETSSNFACWKKLV